MSIWATDTREMAMISPQAKQCGWEGISVPLMVQQLILVVLGCLLTSGFGVVSVWINIVRTAPAMAYVRQLGFNLNESTRGLIIVLEAVRVMDVVCW